MGIYGVKSNTCNCKGSWSTLDSNDLRIYMETPCPNHQIREGNIIYYELRHLLHHVVNIKNNIRIREKYPVKVLDIKEIDRCRKIIKIEVDHNGEIDVDNFDNFNQRYFSLIFTK